MADTIQIKASDTVGASFLADRELAYSRAEKALYIGAGGRRNQKLCSAETTEQVDKLKTAVEAISEEFANKLTATAIEAQSKLSAESDLSSVINAFNALMSAMKTSGIMK